MPHFNLGRPAGKIIVHPATGEARSIPEWARILNLKPATLYARYETRPLDGGYILFKGKHRKSRPPPRKNTGPQPKIFVTHPKTKERKSLIEWSKITGVAIATLYCRYHSRPNDPEYILHLGKHKKKSKKFYETFTL